MNEAESFLGELSAEVHSRMTKLNVKCRMVTLKLKTRHPDAPIEPAKYMGMYNVT